jgi:hypothetical protein
MVFKTNYNQQRMERDRAKKAKKEEKLRERQEEAARRKAAGLPPEDPTDPGAEAPAPLEGNT